MSQVICSSCFEVEDTTKRFIELPYICVRCEKDSALALDQDGWETEYVDPACQQAAEEIDGLYIEEDDFPCDDATTYYIIEARGKFKSYDWFRSQNPDTEGVFDDYSTALEAAEREQDGSSVEYRVVEYRPESTPCDAPYNSGVPCQESNLDTLAKLMRNPSILETLNARGETVDYEEINAFIRANHNSDILDQFNEDTKLIDDLRLQLEQANLNVQILEETIEDLETQLTDLRLDICNVVFRTVPQADGYSTDSGDSKESGPLSHLPEGSH
jgi:hypothetical protein